MEDILSDFLAFSKKEPATKSAKTKKQKNKRRREEEANPPPPKRETVQHSFPTEPEDHAETDDKAYEDVVPVLEVMAAAMGKDKGDIALYDPYFCQGAVKKRLEGLGFPKCYNENEDFYKVAEEEECPEHDILLTNPPYSADHMERILAFCKRRNQGRPFMLLMPGWVYNKPYYKRVLGALEERMDYIVPARRYYYWAPKDLTKSRVEKEGEAPALGGSGKKKRTHTRGGAERTAPWVSFWYCYFGDEAKRKAVRTAWKKHVAKRGKGVDGAYMTRDPPAQEAHSYGSKGVDVVEDSSGKKYSA
eukprot:CAMPEP_0182900856 /NCGR_PEP_ID=MMETSP0034_2-20130328/29171_1 /TAXON_ID=156128 /ORGANISM="Nephroselmis pyriformis, Strain CCMP717" /LENGTH=303 /DNA_ID=CAMNT_0025035137 /DNA_START=734 /DNA_END=1642 /DNA_ORIENTATION=+